MLVITAVAALGGLTLLLATGLVVANRTLYVEEDPRFDEVEDMLPHTNCGACGYPGCRSFAEALVNGDVLPGKCTVSSGDDRADIAAYLGVDVGAEERRVARLACAGGKNVARNHARYTGYQSCRSAALVAGGGKGCFWGCLGLGDCERICDFDAIIMDAQNLPVVIEELCTACNDCVEVCPKDLFSIHPASHRLWVACKNLEFGDDILEDCEVGCTACGRCAKDAPGLISMQDNLAVVDYDRAHGTRLPIERCPTGAIVWIEEDGHVIKGDEARPTLRHSSLPEAPT
ncbi:MAG: RnfABCDGE type electron transport complex subunit B [Gammaproteobacteria bacterium]|nr:RnfABCDGE type electron transport complex subunit B [Gammaproteobacteria bacterium]MDH3751423.1 RnfABCDGE type electron transport complex subunit B [Gammaproteobacteria bacterium]